MRLREGPVTAPTARRAAGWSFAAVATWAAVFVLPYRFPPRESVLSATWIAGANNQVAAVALALVSVAVLAVLWSRRNTHILPNEPTGELDRRWLLGGAIAAIAWTALLGTAVARAHMYWGDEGYFLNQLRTGIAFHQKLYRDFEFPYGPLLYHWPALCIQVGQYLHLSIAGSYLVSLALLQVAGLALLFYTVQALPLRRSLKTAAFVLLTFGTLTSLLGLNYSIFRFILPYAAIVLLTRQQRLVRAVLVAGAAEIIALAVSPELGVAFALAVLACSLHWAIVRGRRWICPFVATLAGALLFVRLIGPDYFFTLHNMAKGGFNLLLAPVPHILGLLFAVVVLSPIAVMRMLAREQRAAALGAGFYAAALGLLPAAMGRCDPIHVFFNGLGFWMLCFITLNAAAVRWRRAGVAVLAVVFLLTQAANFRLYQYRLSLVLRRVPVQEDWGFDEARLRETIGTARISAPVLAPERILDDLTRSGQYVPGYFCGWVGVWDRQSEERVIADTRRTPFALVAFADPVFPDPAGDRRIERIMRFGLANHPLRPVYVRGALLDAELKANWQPIGIYGDYALFRKLR